MASGAIDGIINIFDVQSNRLVHTLEGLFLLKVICIMLDVGQFFYPESYWAVQKLGRGYMISCCGVHALFGCKINRLLCPKLTFDLIRSLFPIMLCM